MAYAKRRQFPLGKGCDANDDRFRSEVASAATAGTSETRYAVWETKSTLQADAAPSACFGVPTDDSDTNFSLDRVILPIPFANWTDLTVVE
jgi:hypothetical protein